MPVDVLMHVDTPLDEARLQAISSAPGIGPGVVRFSFEAHAPRFLRFTYDPGRVTAKQVLDAVAAMGYRGRLVAI